MSGLLDRRLGELIRSGSRLVTADDVTIDGAIAIDSTHAANGRQSAIGSAFRGWAEDGLIVRTGRVVRSKAPRRKGGMIQVWAVTDVGVEWAWARLELSRD